MNLTGQSGEAISDPGESGARPAQDGAGATQGAVAVQELPPLPRQYERVRSVPRGIRMPERFRAMVQCGAILKRLHDIHAGRVVAHPALLAVQVQAAKVLLAKALPDLQSVTISGDANAPLVVLTRLE